MLKKFNKPAACAFVLLFAGSAAYAETMLGAYIENDGWKPKKIDAFNSAASKPLGIVTLFSSFDYNWDKLAIQSSNIVSRNAAPMITWMPTVATRSNDNLLPEILAGNWDSYIDSWINGLSLWLDSYPLDQRPTILLRFAHEFNGIWYPWSNQPESFKAAWRYIHQRFQDSGINENVEWVWCANNVNVDDYDDFTIYYPGNDVVDWTSLDGYNWGSNYAWSDWKSFAETFSLPYNILVENYPDKPIILAEVASAEPGDKPSRRYGQDGDDSDANQSKELWVYDMYYEIMTNYSWIKGVSWFNINKELSWALNGRGNTGLDAYNEIILDDHFLGYFEPGMSVVMTASSEQATVLLDNEAADESTADAQQTESGSVLPWQARVRREQLPEIVGADLLEREKQGLRNMPEHAIEAWRDGRLKNQR